LAAVCVQRASAIDAASIVLKGKHFSGDRGAGLRLSSGSAHKTEPFDIDPDTFMATLQAVPTDALLLFYSPTCSDCEKLMPQWAKIAGKLDARSDLTLLTVADPEGKATGGYHHGENPALFFVPRERQDEPLPFSLGKLHAFIDTDETPATEAAIRKDITDFALSHLGGKAQASDTARRASDASPGDEAPAAKGADADESMLTAKLLVALRNHEQAGREAQMELLTSPAFAKLPVAQAMTLLGPQNIKEPLAVVAARFLDEEPQAKQAAKDYARWYLKKSGQERAGTAEYQKKFADVEAYVLPSKLRGIFDRGGR